MKETPVESRVVPRAGRADVVAIRDPIPICSLSDSHARSGRACQASETTRELRYAIALPLAGEGWGGGWPQAQCLETPTPNPSPQGGGEQEPPERWTAREFHGHHSNWDHTAIEARDREARRNGI